MPLTAEDIIPGKCYRAKKPKTHGIFPKLIADRQVLWVDSFRSQVQYDSPTVSNGRHHPRVSMAKFLAWAGHQVTLPAGEWEEAK